MRRFYLDATLLALQPDLVHFEFGSLAVDRMHLKDLLGCRVVVSFRGYDLNLTGLEKPDYFRAVWEGADALHLLGESLWRKAQQRGCPAAQSHALIPPAIDTVYFAPEESPPRENGAGQPLRLLCVGRLTWEKGGEHALQALRLLLDQGVPCELRMVGEGPMLEALAFACHQLGVKDQVRFLGALPRARIRDEMRAADVFLQASDSEGFCNAVVEAQAMGLPVVCSDAGGLPENVADGESGFVVPRRDPGALAGKLAVLARDPALRRRMGQAGRQRVVAHFQIQDQVSRFDHLYHGVLKPSPARR